MFTSIERVACLSPRVTTASSAQPWHFGGAEGVTEALLHQSRCMQEITCQPATWFLGDIQKCTLQLKRRTTDLLWLAFWGFLSRTNTISQSNTKVLLWRLKCQDTVVMCLVLSETVMLMAEYNWHGQLRVTCQRPWADTFDLACLSKNQYLRFGLRGCY